MNFSAEKSLCLYFGVMLKSESELSYFQEEGRWKLIIKNFKEPLFLTGCSEGYNFLKFLRHLNVVSKKCSFATLANMRQKLRQFKLEK